MTEEQLTEASFKRTVKCFEKEDTEAMLMEVRKLIVYAVNKQYMNHQMEVIATFDEVESPQMRTFLNAIICAQQNNWRKKLITHSKICRQWLRLNGIYRHW